MSDIAVLAYRDPTRPLPPLADLFASLCTVPGFDCASPQFWKRFNTMACLLNPQYGSLFQNDRLGLGILVNDPVLSVVFENSEIVAQTDFFGSRPVWYFQDSDVFILSTSQFCVAAMFDELRIDHDTVSWFLSSGFVGHAAYDKRINRLFGNQKLSFDLKTWNIQITSCLAQETDVFKSFDDVISEVLDDIKFDIPVLIPISGGVDSRIILSYMADKKKNKIKAVTWGRPGAETVEDSDAFVAQLVCERVGIDFEYLAEAPNWEDPEHAMAQYITYSEGMVDHLHVQNLRPMIARWCLQRQIGCMVRGDEIFGSRPVFTDRDARHSIDLYNAKEVARNWPEFGDIWSMQNPIAGMERLFGESPTAYRDRIYREIRCPGVLAGLNGAFARHIEVVNPLLDRRIVRYIEGRPDTERTKKQTYLPYAVKRMPGLRFAEFGSISETRDLLGRDDVRGYLRERISSREAKDFFGSSATERLDRELARPRRAVAAGAYFGSGLLGTVVRRVGKEKLLALRTAMWSYPGVEASRMALRAVAALEMIDRLGDAVHRGRLARET